MEFGRSGRPTLMLMSASPDGAAPGEVGGERSEPRGHRCNVGEQTDPLEANVCSSSREARRRFRF
jgi:hypothetical protein